MALGLSVVQQEKLNDAMQGFHTLFSETRGRPFAIQELINRLAMYVESSNPVEVYNFLQAVPSMKEWAAERMAKKLAAEGFKVYNKDWEATVDVSINDLDDDRLGLYRPRIAGLARGYEKLILRLLVELIENGFVTTGPGGACYDGKAFFSTTHKNGKGSTSNKLTKALSATDPSDNFELAVEMLQDMKDEEGEPLYLGQSGLYLLVAPKLKSAAKKIVGLASLSGGGDNPNYGAAEIVVLSGLGDTKWAVADLAMEELKPLIHQNRQPVRSSDTSGGDGEFKTKQVMFGADARAAVAYANWQTIVASDGTT